MQRLTHFAAAVVAIAALMGCAATPPGQAPPPEQAAPPRTEPSIPGQSIKLPDGKQLSTADLPDVVNVRLEILGIGGAGGNPVAMAAGNHVEQIRQEEVTLPIGKAYLAVVVRGQPAAANSQEKTHELWLIAVRKHPSRAEMRLAYSIIGKITGDEAKAKAQLLELGQHWQLPPE